MKPESSPQPEQRHDTETIGELSREELETLHVPLEAILHIARHLRSLDTSARDDLLGQTVTGEDGKPHPIDRQRLRAATETIGSKFHPSLDEPQRVVALARMLLNRALQEQRIPWVQQSDGVIEASALVTITRDEKVSFGFPFDQQLGDLSLVPITEERQSRVRQVTRGSAERGDAIPVNVVDGEPIPQTDDVVIVLRRDSPDAPPHLHTVYTGVLAPPLPRPDRLTDEELAASREFWDHHAFVTGG